MADKGGRGRGEMMTTAEKGAKRVWNPLFLADIICEQPLMCSMNCIGAD